jgi:hypothetical protein
MKNNKKKKLSEEEIDEIVVREANDPSKWDGPIRVVPPTAIALKLSPHLIERAKRIAKRKRIGAYQDWLSKVVEERIVLEESRPRSIPRRVV